MQWDVGGRIREEGGCQIKLLSLDFTLCAEKWVGGFEVVRCDFIININFQNSSAATESKGSRRKGQELGPLEVPILEGHVPQLLHWIQADVPLSPLCRLQPKQSAPVPPGPLFFSVYLQHTQTKGILPFLPGHSADHLPSIWEHVLVTQSCPALCDPVDCSPTGSSVHGIL